MGDEDDDKQQGRFAKANAFLSKLAMKENGGKDDAEEEEEEDIDGEKNADKFVREFNDMQKTMKESTKTYAKGEPANAEDEEEEEGTTTKAYEIVVVVVVVVVEKIFGGRRGD